jgi:hypothetical protein
VVASAGRIPFWAARYSNRRVEKSFTVKSTIVSSKAATRNRRDHYLPQGYLRGFIDPARVKLPKPLWCFHLHTRKWRECGPKEIGYIDGFYDYATENVAAEHPDITFKRLENDFPLVRARILRDGFSSWIGHKEFLLAYMQMIRARSPLFFDQWHGQAKTIRLATVTEVLHEHAVKVDSLEGRAMTEGEIQNWTISKMREEIKKGPDWLADFHWALRYTDSPSDPVITAEQPFVSIGISSDVAAAMSHPDTLIYFPICWQAFLFGSVRRFDVETERFHPDTLQWVRRAYIQNGRNFLVSPQKLDVL